METINIIDADGNTFVRPMTPEEEYDAQHDFMCELENDHYEEPEEVEYLSDYEY